MGQASGSGGVLHDAFGGKTFQVLLVQSAVVRQFGRGSSPQLQSAMLVEKNPASAGGTGVQGLRLTGGAAGHPAEVPPPLPDVPPLPVAAPPPLPPLVPLMPPPHPASASMQAIVMTPTDSRALERPAPMRVTSR
jgi:hypothetical protein